MKRALHRLLFTNTSTKQILIKNTFWLMLSEVVAKGLLFIITISVVRYLGATEYGKYSTAIAFTSLFSVIVDFGLGTMLVTELASSGKEKSASLFGSILSLKLVLSVISALSILVASYFVHFPPDVLRLVYLSGLYMLLQSFVLIFPALFQAYESMQFSFIVRTGTNIILCGLVLLAISMKLSAIGILSAYIVTATIMLLICLYLVKRYLFSIEFGIQKDMIVDLLRRSWPLFLGNVCATIYLSADTTMLGFMRGYTEVGIYQAAYKILYVFQTLNLVHVALLPRMAELYRTNRPALKKLLKLSIGISLLILVPVLSIIGIYRNKIVYLVYGARFVGAGDVLIILIIGGAISFISSYISSMFLFQKKYHKWLAAQFFALVVNIFVNIALISIAGPVGAAFGYLIGCIVMLIFYIISI